MEYRYTLKNFWGHLRVVNQHRFKVFCLCCKAGIPFRGLVHDLSKYSLEEFLEGVKYFSEEKSPISNCKRVNGYSKAWLHHKGRNKHHYEYWYDYTAPDKTPFMPYKYFAEMICDNVAAGMTYQKEKWTKEYQLTYWNRVRDKVEVSSNMRDLLTRVYTDLSVLGVDKIINKDYLQKVYEEYKNKPKEEIEIL